MRASVLLASCLVIGCNASSVMHAGGAGGAPVGGGRSGGGGAGGSSGGGGTGGSGGGSDDCSEAAKLVYVIDENGTFSSFAPDQTDISKSVFTDIAKLSCPSKLNGTPFSMSIDRAGTAWIEYVAVVPVLGTYSGAELFQVDTKSAHCVATSYVSGQQGMEEVGLGFVSDAAGSDHETLFVSGGKAPDALGNYAGTNLGTLDPATLTVTKGAAVQGRPELTGTGLGTLWGFFPDATGTSMPRISQLDKVSAAESNTIQLSQLAGMPRAWAYAFWGGDNWVFLRRTAEAATTVYRVRPDGTVTSFPTGNRSIVGAGVSTCAPVVPIS